MALLGAGGLAGLGASRLRGGEAPEPERRVAPDEEDDFPMSGLQRVIWSVDAETPIAALTFDDGPDPRFTPRILDLLDRYKVRATFMVMGYNGVQHAGLLRELVAAGHEVGSHGWSHLNLAEARAPEIRNEIEFGTRMIEDRTQAPVQFFRSPYARFGEAALRLLALSQRDMVLWSVTRGKLSWREPNLVSSHVLGSAAPGDIVALHDGIGRGTFNPGAAFTDRLRRRREVEIEALPRILEGAKARGLRLGTVSDLLAASKDREA